MAWIRTWRMMRASRQAVWDVVTDLESWPTWGSPDAPNRILEHKIVGTENGNVIICTEKWRAWILVASQKDRYTLIPPGHLREEILPGGDMSGYFRMNLWEEIDGTFVDVESEVTPRKILPRFLSFFAGSMILRDFWNDLLQQIAERAEVAALDENPPA